MDMLGGVDFHKGCYVGQEVVSRMQHRGTARTRIVPTTPWRSAGSADRGPGRREGAGSVAPRPRDAALPCCGSTGRRRRLRPARRCWRARRRLACGQAGLVESDLAAPGLKHPGGGARRNPPVSTDLKVTAHGELTRRQAIEKIPVSRIVAQEAPSKIGQKSDVLGLQRQFVVQAEDSSRPGGVRDIRQGQPDDPDVEIAARATGAAVAQRHLTTSSRHPGRRLRSASKLWRFGMLIIASVAATMVSMAWGLSGVLERSPDPGRRIDDDEDQVPEASCPCFRQRLGRLPVHQMKEALRADAVDEPAVVELEIVQVRGRPIAVERFSILPFDERGPWRCRGLGGRRPPSRSTGQSAW